MKNPLIVIFMELGGFALILFLIQWFKVVAGAVIVFASMIWPTRPSDRKKNDAKVDTGRGTLGLTGSIRGALAALGVVIAVYGLFAGGSDITPDCKSLPFSLLEGPCTHFQQQTAFAEREPPTQEQIDAIARLYATSEAHKAKLREKYHCADSLEHQDYCYDIEGGADPITSQLYSGGDKEPQTGKEAPVGANGLNSTK